MAGGAIDDVADSTEELSEGGEFTSLLSATVLRCRKGMVMAGSRKDGHSDEEGPGNEDIASGDWTVYLKAGV